MVYKFFGATLALVWCVGVLLADLIPGRITNIDATKNTITVNAQGKEQTFLVAKDVKVWKVAKPAERKKVAELVQLPEGLRALQPGMDVTLTRGAYKLQYVITSIQLGVGATGSAAGQ